MLFVEKIKQIRIYFRLTIVGLLATKNSNDLNFNDITNVSF